MGTGIGTAISAFFQRLPWWLSAAIFLLLFVCGLLRASYEEVQKHKKEHRELEKKKDKELWQVRAQRKQIEAEKKDLEKQLTTVATRKALKDLLADAIDAGRKLQRFAYMEKDEIKKVTEKDIENWVSRTRSLIKAALDDGEVRLFISNDGITLENLYGYKPDDSWLQMVAASMETWTDARIKRLHELIVRMDRLDIRSDFDPQGWKGYFDSGISD